MKLEGLGLKIIRGSILGQMLGSYLLEQQQVEEVNHRQQAEEVAHQQQIEHI